MVVRVINNSSHDFMCIGSYGSSISCNKVFIPAKNTVEIGTVDLPEKRLSKGNWGWWYVQDILNKAVVELFAFAGPDSHDGDKVNAGLRANNCHNKDNGPFSPAPGYFDTDKGKSSFTFIIQSKWTDNPPAYI